MRGRWVLIGLLWIATVAGTSALVWTVISVAGLRGGNTAMVASAPADPDGTAVPGYWRGAVGRVTATCKGDDISIGTVVPQPGYTAEFYNRGPVRLELEFEGTQGGSDVYLIVRCVDGAPQFQHR
ncbi:hypothetical protein ATK74_2157 [Propionicimonas paludicola]|uniref:Uncharacterized protein n=1 Tax=Propionicimonas paludicola TaxID=185243 RepID=A0A2A9CT27_9ACTN|nr:hypothetical protein [Propionicimonas paludicola]PFG17584.1 hypothetical protein ATK74_2157 [Propionicimonas paludicola]